MTRAQLVLKTLFLHGAFPDELAIVCSPPAKAGLLKLAVGKAHVGLSSPRHVVLLCMTAMQPASRDSSGELDNI